MSGSSPHTRGARAVRRHRRHLQRDHPRIRGEHIQDTPLTNVTPGSSPHTRGARWTAWDRVRGCRDHPRIRGEHPAPPRNHQLQPGSSPHTRGALEAVRGHVNVARIIPAYAGSTTRRPVCRCSKWDHPRIRGEHKCGSRLKITNPGSSPHTRGALERAGGPPAQERIIPAYAGSTRCRRRRRGRSRGSSPHTRGAPRARPRHLGAGWDHPRIRGEHSAVIDTKDRHAGSSPHTRGALDEAPETSVADGIIPAYAGSTVSSHAGIILTQDHPRIRGEHILDRRHPNLPPGSSPHTRGALDEIWISDRGGGIIPAYAGSTRGSIHRENSPRDHPRIRGEHLARGGFGRPASRIIPAYAGSTDYWLRRRPCAPDHPRIRGEHIRTPLLSTKRDGSSPHTRGALDSRDPGCRYYGIIPAYAGSTRSRRRRPWAAGDHPRIRGEHAGARAYTPSRLGSSPHTRGAQCRPATTDPGDRIIPAYAGSTRVAGGGAAELEDHPRIRGEHMGFCLPHTSTPGSSPHTRGARRIPPRSDGRGGIIPAYAGSTPRAFQPISSSWDHPRIRGEHVRTNRTFSRSTGSSPHTRGAHVKLVRESIVAGIIPAYAGSTSGLPLAEWRRADHPRIRGEHHGAAHECRPFAGSSPHTRGAQAYVQVAGRCGRIIPAYAGSTQR